LTRQIAAAGIRCGRRKQKMGGSGDAVRNPLATGFAISGKGGNRVKERKRNKRLFWTSHYEPGSERGANYQKGFGGGPQPGSTPLLPTPLVTGNEGFLPRLAREPARRARHDKARKALGSEGSRKRSKWGESAVLSSKARNCKGMSGGNGNGKDLWKIEP